MEQNALIAQQDFIQLKAHGNVKNAKMELIQKLVLHLVLIAQLVLLVMKIIQIVYYAHLVIIQMKELQNVVDVKMGLIQIELALHHAIIAHQGNIQMKIKLAAITALLAHFQ